MYVVKFMIYYEDKKYKFFELFNEKNGTLIRSDISGTQMNATMRSFPELLDIGIMGQCSAAKAGMCSRVGVECYQNAINSNKKNMSLETICKIENTLSIEIIKGLNENEQ